MDDYVGLHGIITDPDTSINDPDALVEVSLEGGGLEWLAAWTLGHGVEAEVLDLRVLRPLDVETVLESVARTHRVVVVDDGSADGSREIPAVWRRFVVWNLGRFDVKEKHSSG